MNTDQGSFITEEHYRAIRKYEESASFDYDKLKLKYEDPFSSYPSEGISASPDVVIAGGGPSGLMFALYLIQRGYRVIILEPQEIGYTSRDWNISLDEIMHLKCILSEEDILACISGRIVTQGSIQFKDLFTYRCTDVLDRIVDPEKFLILLELKIISLQGGKKEDIFFKSRYENLKIKDDRICIFTADGRKLEAKFFLHGMGSQDEINWYANYDRAKIYYHAVGINARIGNTIRPHADVLRTIEDASYGPHKQQIIWQFFMSEEPHTDCATIYIFAMDRERMSLVALMKYFAENVCRYLQADIAEVSRILFGYITLPDDVTGLTRSAFPRVYSIGECNVNSVATGCGFAMCIKNLDVIGYQLARVLKKDTGTLKSMSAAKLNKIKPDIRQLCSISIEQLSKEMVMRADNESVEKPNRHSAIMFRLFSLISDEKGRNDMLKCIIRPHLFLDALIRVRSETDITIKDFFETLQSNNRDLFQRLRLIAYNYWILILCEIKEVFKHLLLTALCRRGEFIKSRKHIRNIFIANPIRFYTAHRFLKKQAKQKTM